MSVFLLALLAAIANMALGFVWYLPSVFGTIWMREVGINPNTANKKPMITAMVSGFISYTIMAIILTYVLPFGTVPLAYIYLMTCMLWIGFVLAIRLTHALFEQKSVRYIAITSGHDLLGLLITVSILSLSSSIA